MKDRYDDEETMIFTIRVTDDILNAGDADKLEAFFKRELMDAFDEFMLADMGIVIQPVTSEDNPPAGLLGKEGPR